MGRQAQRGSLTFLMLPSSSGFEAGFGGRQCGVEHMCSNHGEQSFMTEHVVTQCKDGTQSSRISAGLPLPSPGGCALQ